MLKVLSPKKTKHRKYQRGRNRGKATSNNTITFGDFALQTLEGNYITDRQIEAARRALTRYMKRAGKVWIKIFPDRSMTRLPAETRMGKGKGNPEFGKFPYRKGENMCLYADISKAKQLMNWKPLVSLEEGLKKTIFHAENDIKK